MNKKLVNLCMTALLSVVSTTAWALSEVNGFYQIGSAADYAAFTQIVNGGTRNANAILTADIDLGSITTQIGVGGDYQGLFDGAGHTITINLADRTDGEGPALFRGIGNLGIVQNLKVQGTIATGTSKHTAAIANYSAGLIRCCFADVTINSSFADNADASIGGIAGQLNRPAVIENCLSKIKIVGSTTHKCGGLAAWVDAQRINIVNCLVINDKESNFNWSDGKSAGLVRDGDGLLKTVDLSTYNANNYNNRPQGANGNNYVTNSWGVVNEATTNVVTPEEVASGKVCYQLNSDQSHIGWVQNIGDPYPVPAVFGKDKGQVYASTATDCQGKATGEVTFSNTPSNAAVTKHTYDKYGVCTTCGQFNWNCFSFEDPTRFEPATKSVLLSSAEDLYLAEGWNRLQNGFKLNMKMVKDIECTPTTGQLIFNSADWMDSSFDGDGHTLTINLVDIKESNASFLPQFSGNFENVIMHGSISTSQNHGASISGYFRGNGQKIRNVFSDININTTLSGDNTCGGLAGVDAGNVSFENCVYAGDIIGVNGTTCIAGFTGWANGKTFLTNCAFVGSLTNAGGDSHTIGRNNGNIICSNVYSLNEYNNSDAGKYIKTTAEAVANGELAYLLNGKENGVERFYQLIGTDKYPAPIAKEGALVYPVAASYRCDGKALGDDTKYGNTPVADIPNHEFEDGICKNCGALETDNEGYKKIVNGKGLAQFSKLVNDGKTDMKVRLYNDIDMTDIEYATAGNSTCRFTGEFDGQNHVISNLKITSNEDYQGLIGVLGAGAVVKNLILDKSCSITGKAFTGMIGGTWGAGKVYITNVGNEGTVTGTAQNISGILGVDMDGSMDMFITNCYVTGAIKGNRESATICSWSSANSQVTNCWSTATLEGKYGNNSFTRGNTFVTNCYEIEGVGTQNNNNKDKTNIITAAEVESGALCVKLNGAFRQTIGEDKTPVLDQTHGIVKQISEAGYATLYVADTDVEIPAGVTANAGVLEGNWLVMKAIEGKIAAGEAVVLKGDAGIYSFVPTTGATKAAANDLKGAAVDTDATGKYVLAQPENEAVGFYLANGGKIAAGKAYLELPAAGVKAFYFEADDATAINEVNAQCSMVNGQSIYNLAGQRINKLQKGINIVGGKKILF